MKIGLVHTLYDALPYQPGLPIKFGPLIDRRRAPDFCPRLYFEFPIRRPVTAVVWFAPRADGYFISMNLYHWDAGENPQTVPDVAGETEGMVPQYAEIAVEPTREICVMLQCAQKYWQPFTALKAAPKLLPALVAMTDEEHNQFMEKLGQSRNPQTIRTNRENLFIASRWIDWEREEASFQTRAEDMKKHGFPIGVEALKKRAGARGLNLPSGC